MRAQEFAERFAIPGLLDFPETPDGLVKAVVACEAGAAELFLQGAQLTSWVPAGERPVLFTSSRSLFAPGKAIRGGIPIIFPWFGPYRGGSPAPQHGFARVAPWRLDGVERAADGGISLALSLDHAGGAPPWPQAMRVEYRIGIGKALFLELTALNRSSEPVTFEAALHSYFAVADVAQVRVSGLEERTFIDKVDGMRRKRQGPAPLVLAGATDSVYLDTPTACAIDDPLWRRRIIVGKDGARSTIVWNPWQALADLGDNDWRSMICVETGSVADNAITLAPGLACRMTTRIAGDAAG